MAGEEDISVDIHGRTYIIEFGVMHQVCFVCPFNCYICPSMSYNVHPFFIQINEESGNTRAIRRSTVDPVANKDSEVLYNYWHML